MTGIPIVSLKKFQVKRVKRVFVCPFVPLLLLGLDPTNILYAIGASFDRACGGIDFLELVDLAQRRTCWTGNI